MEITIAYYTLYGLSIFGIFVVSALLYLKRQQEEYGYFAIFAVLLNCWLFLQLLAQVFSDDATLFLRMSVAVAPFFILYFFFFARRYVGLRKKRAHHFILPAIIAAVAVTTDLMIRDASASIDGFVIYEGPLYYFVFVVIGLYAAASIAYIIRGSRSDERRTASKKQADVILAAAVVQAIVIVAVASIFFADVPLAQALIPFALFMMVVIFSYAVIRHKLFDIRLIAVRALAYIFSLATLGGVYALAAFVLVNVILGERGDVSHQIFYLLLALGLALTFAPLKSFFDRVTRSIFYQDSYEPQRVIDEFSSLLVSTVDIDKLSQQAAQILRDAMKSQYVSILLPFEGGKKTHRLITNGDGTMLKRKSFSQLLHSKTEKVVTRDDLREGDAKLAHFMQEIECSTAARLEAHGELIGFILFGDKFNARHYTHHDLELIHITTDELALGIQNALRFEEIRMFNKTLQEKIEDATLRLRKTNAELRRLDEAKDEFVSMASHQLRTPLTSVKGYLSMVLEGDVGRISAAQRQLLSEAFTSSERMVHLIGDFLNVSRLQTGKFMIEAKPIDLSKVIAQEVESLQTTANARDLKLMYRAPSSSPILYIDEGKIRQVVMNFIDNAIYYSDEGATITVRLATEGGDMVLTVHDTGIGVPKSEQAHLFTKFFRATNAQKQRPDGTGVGLFLAKKVIVAHGGTMLFESKEGEGSTFGFRLPVKKLSNPPADEADKLDK